MMQSAEVIPEPDEEEEPIEPLVPSTTRRFLNLRLRFLVRNCIAVRSTMLNRKLMKQGRSSSLFTVKIGPNHCISNRSVTRSFVTYFAKFGATVLNQHAREFGKEDES